MSDEAVRLLFNASESTSLRVVSRKFTESYAVGKVKGRLTTDTVRLSADGSGPALSAVPLGLVTIIEDSPVVPPIQGIIGLSYRALAVGGVAGLFDEVVRQGAVKRDAFGMYLSVTDKGERQGMLTLGGADSTLYTGKLRYAPLIDNEWYVIQMAGMHVGDTRVVRRARAIVDSGTSCLLGPADEVERLLRAPGVVEETDCDRLDQLPNVTVQIGAEFFPIQPSDYMLDIGNNRCHFCIDEFPSDSADQRPFEWILGDPFARSVYVLHDRTYNRMGFAPAVQNSTQPLVARAHDADVARWANRARTASANSAT
jgi:cathepsin D